MKGKIILILMLGVFLISLVSAATTLGTFKQGGTGDCVDLIQTCGSCSYNNISSVVRTGENPQTYTINTKMTKDDTFYNYSFCNITNIGTYNVHGFGDLDGDKTSWVYDFVITEGGEGFNNSQAIMILGFFGMVCLFFGIGMAFKKEKWKLRSFFFLCSLLMGVIFLNSIRIIIGTSTNLAKMGSTGLILGIVILLFMFLYSFIHYTIEAFKYFKEKRKMKWNI